MNSNNIESLEAFADYFRTGYLLVVDDARNMRKTLKGMLRHFGIAAVREADDGDSALELLATAEEKCLFILLDWNMPRMNGVKVARELKCRDCLKDIPILMITAEGNQSQVAYAGEFGVDGYIIKPFGASVLEEKMIVALANILAPSDCLKLLNAGDRHMGSGELEKALAYYREALKHEENAKIYLKIAETMAKLGMVPDATQAFRTCVEKSPQFMRGLNAASEFHLKLGDEEGALRYLTLAREVSPLNPTRHAAMGKLFLKRGDEAAASRSFQDAVRNDPAMSTQIAEELLQEGKAEMAEVYFRWSLENQENSIHTYNRLGIALRRQGKWDEAVREYKAALVLAPDDEVLYFNMAKAYLEGKRKREAAQCLSRALEINPDFREAREELDNIAKGIAN